MIASSRIRSNGGKWIRLAEGDCTAAGVLGYESKLRGTFGDSIESPVARDLLRLGQTAFLADRCFRRGTALGSRTRLIDLQVQVSDRALWSAVAEEVQNLLSFLSQDRWRVEFIDGREPDAHVKPKQLGLVAPSVNLFSDGLDSLCGAAAALSRGESPILVSHSPPGASKAMSRINALRSKLAKESQEIQFANLHFRADQKTMEGDKSLFPERSRLSRPFLYLSIAGAVAIELGVDRINLSENGFLSYNLPLSPSRHGVDVTRHSHSKLLVGFRELLSHLLPEKDWQVLNPFFDMTKGEELVHLGPALYLAQETVTCTYARQQMSTYIGRMRRHGLPLANPPRECGICTACIVRRAALLSRGVAEKTTHYAFDTPSDLDTKKHRPIAQLFDNIRGDYEDMLAFASRMSTIAHSDFIVEFLPELSLGAASASVTDESQRVRNLCRRAADELLRYYGVRGN